MNTMYKTPQRESLGGTIGGALGKILGSYAGVKIRDTMEARKQSQLQQALNKFMTSEEYQNMPLTQKIAVTGARFGPEAAKAVVEGEKIEQQQQESAQEQLRNLGVQKLIQTSDFSTPEGQRDFLSKSSMLGVKPTDAAKIMNELKPSMLGQFLSGYQEQQPQQPAMEAQEAAQQQAQAQQQQQPMQPQQQAQQPVQPQQQAQVVSEAQQQGVQQQPLLQPIKEGAHPALRDTPYKNVPDKDLALAASSSDKELSNFGNAVLELRNREHSRFSDDRKYHTAKAKSFADEMVQLRKDLPGKEAALSAIEYAIKTGKLGMFSRDYWADTLGRFGKGLVTPEGALLKSAVKEFLIADLARLKGRPNQFIEQRILSMMAQIGQTDEANLTMNAFVKYNSDSDRLRLDMYDKLSEAYEARDGFVPGNIDALVDKQLQPEYKKLQEKLSYDLRELQEKHTGFEKISKKKVPPGTPLTLGMATYLSGKHGKEKGMKIAEQLGYK